MISGGSGWKPTYEPPSTATATSSAVVGPKLEGFPRSAGVRRFWFEEKHPEVLIWTPTMTEDETWLAEWSEDGELKTYVNDDGQAFFDHLEAQDWANVDKPDSEKSSAEG